MLNFSSKKKATSFQTNNIHLDGYALAAPRRGGRVLLYIFVFTFIAVTFIFFKVELGSVSSFVASPVFRIAHWYKTSSAALPTYMRGVDALRRERDAALEDLTRAREELQGQVYASSQCSEERSHIDGTYIEEQLQYVGVLAAPPRIAYDALVVDAGSQDGIQERASVYHYGNRAVGFVQKVFETTSLVVLYTSPGIKTGVYLSGSRAYFDMYGAGGGVACVHVPQNVQVEVGETVLLPGIKGGYIGTVQYIDARPSSPEKQACVAEYFPGNMRIVRVAKEPPGTYTVEEIRAMIREEEVARNLMQLPDELKNATTTEEVATTTEERSRENNAMSTE